MHQLRASLTKGGCCVYVTKKKNLASDQNPNPIAD